MKAWSIDQTPWTAEQLREFWREGGSVSVAPAALDRVEASQRTIDSILRSGKTVYGVNTGFGLLAHQTIPAEDVVRLQRHLVLSHAAGVGPLLGDDVVRLVMLLKLRSLLRGHSGIRPEVIRYLMAFLNQDISPCLPSKGSVGASGDLAPLAHLAAAFMGLGNVRIGGATIPAEQALARLKLPPLQLAAKEGLALLNGTQVSNALALVGLFRATEVFHAALVAGAMSVDAAKGSDVPFDARISAARPHRGQADCASVFRVLLEGSAIRHSHLECKKVQDPYSLRCQPQVMGACLDHMRFATGVLVCEANSSTDNPLVFADSGDVLSGGNFHAEPVAMAADVLALAIAEMGSLSERRIALLVDPHLSGLPAFLVKNSGLNSGFMIAQVTAAALASENKTLAHPASVDSIPTSANQEDHVSMATYAARRLGEMAWNAANIVAIELLAAAQGLDFHGPLTSSPRLEQVRKLIRGRVPHYEKDRWFASDIEIATELVISGQIAQAANLDRALFAP